MYIRLSRIERFEPCMIWTPNEIGTTWKPNYLLIGPVWETCPLLWYCSMRIRIVVNEFQLKLKFFDFLALWIGSDLSSWNRFTCFIILACMCRSRWCNGWVATSSRVHAHLFQGRGLNTADGSKSKLIKTMCNCSLVLVLQKIHHSSTCILTFVYYIILLYMWNVFWVVISN